MHRVGCASQFRNSAVPYKPPKLNFPVIEPGSGIVGQPVTLLDTPSNEQRQGRSVGFGAAVDDQDHYMGFTVRRPAVALDQSSGDGPRSMGFTVRRPAAVAEHSSSDSPQKPAPGTDHSSDSPTTYSQRVKEMSDRETDHEVRWQEWRIEESAKKVRVGRGRGGAGIASWGMSPVPCADSQGTR